MSGLNAAETIRARQKQEKEKLLEQLRKYPIVQFACERSGVARATYYRWIKGDQKFKREADNAMAEGVGFINDLTESQLITLVKEKKLPAIALWLRARHPAFKTRKDDVGAGPVTFNIVKY